VRHRRLVYLLYPPVDIEQRNEQLRVVEHRLELALAPLQVVLAPLSLGDIAGEPGDALDVSVAVENRFATN
jgi:hypothetical protein